MSKVIRGLRKKIVKKFLRRASMSLKEKSIYPSDIIKNHVNFWWMMVHLIWYLHCVFELYSRMLFLVQRPQKRYTSIRWFWKWVLKVIFQNINWTNWIKKDEARHICSNSNDLAGRLVHVLASFMLFLSSVFVDGNKLLLVKDEKKLLILVYTM